MAEQNTAEQNIAARLGFVVFRCVLLLRRSYFSHSFAMFQYASRKTLIAKQSKKSSKYTSRVSDVIAGFCNLLRCFAALCGPFPLPFWLKAIGDRGSLS